MKNKMKSFYTFKGSWFEIFDKLGEILNPQNIQRFAIRESKLKTNEHLLIVYGSRLTSVLQQKHDLEIAAPRLPIDFETKIENLKIHRYNEFNKVNRRTFLYSFSSLKN